MPLLVSQIFVSGVLWLVMACERCFCFAIKWCFISKVELVSHVTHAAAIGLRNGLWSGT